VGFVARLDGTKTHEIVGQGLKILMNIDHRGATGADPAAGDGAGILTQIPDRFLRTQFVEELPELGHYAVGFAFLPVDPRIHDTAKAAIAHIATQEGLKVLGWREVPIRPDGLSPITLAEMPCFEQIIVAPYDDCEGIDLDRMVYPLRRRAELETDVYFASFSSRTIVYKGMLTTTQLEGFFPDLLDPEYESALALVHSRFSTNTFPAWNLAHPFRLIAHNGEINTVRGNRNWMRAREALLKSELLPGDLERIFPICTPNGSDSMSFDEVLELLYLGGRSLAHSILMMIPEAWQGNADMDPKRRAFYEFHSLLMEAWDGPAAVTFTDGTQIGATLDRNGLRPARYWVTKDGLVIYASETGVLDIPADQILTKGRLSPGRVFLVDLDEHRILDDEEVKSNLANEHPYGTWLKENSILLDELPERQHIVHSHASVIRRQQLFGYTNEELTMIVAPMANTGAEPIGSMGDDIPLAALSNRPRLLFDYFKQMFAQVTNPPLDAIREEMVTSLTLCIGPERNLLDPTPKSAWQIQIPFPILDSDQLAKIVKIDAGGVEGYRTTVLNGLYPVSQGAQGLKATLDDLFRQADEAIASGSQILVLSDRHSTAEMAPIPSLLLTSAIHHHLVRAKTRTQVGLIVEAGDVREVHHIACLISYGAAAVNPYLVFESAEDLARHEVHVHVPPTQAITNVRKALGKGVLKVMSKMGISTIASYTGAGVFEAVGLKSEFVSEYFEGTASRIEGIGLDEIAAEVKMRHDDAYPPAGIPQTARQLSTGGQYHWRREGEDHIFDPESIFLLQQSTRTANYETFKRFTARINDATKRTMNLRSLLEFSPNRVPIPIEEVEPISEIVTRFATGAMSYGSISEEAHTTLAIAMNRLGGKSNTGEGGENPDRLHDPARCSAIKQVASGRFGVTSDYLSHAQDIQIKMAQGAKPGEGGQLPGSKVYPWVAKTRHSTPGVGLISPPPHHDIYSIEDIKQLIHDLKCANPSARVHVKLVAQVGVGTVAAGVAKALADVVLISGGDGGTGAAPLTSVRHAGGPWELGLAEAQQTLVINGLRDRITVQVDGHLNSGRDIVIAALLGAEEFGFATAPLMVTGCVMMRACHQDTCPAGVATQNPELRKSFAGKPEHIISYFEFLAQEVREILAELGYRTLQEAIGHVEDLDTRAAINSWKKQGIDLTNVLHRVGSDSPLHKVRDQDHGLDEGLDIELIEAAGPSLSQGTAIVHEAQVRNVDRSVGTLLGHHVTMATNGQGLPEGTIELRFTGTAGQSFGAFIPRGITMNLVGDVNDYLGKGLSGGIISVRPPDEAPFVAEEQIIAGNVIGYGATSGSIFLRGQVGERFCVRNSGATAVVEGTGDHACEYMTGGEVLILGPTGRNLAAGMSGGVAWVLDLDESRLNRELVDGLDLRGEDLSRIRVLLEEHQSYTGSEVARQLLALTDAQLKKRFTLLMPREYAKVLAAMKATQGMSEQEMTKAIMEVQHG
jgi:glutamate synthase (NADPH/NADH) large chain